VTGGDAAGADLYRPEPASKRCQRVAERADVRELRRVDMRARVSVAPIGGDSFDNSDHGRKGAGAITGTSGPIHEAARGIPTRACSVQSRASPVLDVARFPQSGPAWLRSTHGLVLSRPTGCVMDRFGRWDWPTATGAAMTTAVVRVLRCVDRQATKRNSCRSLSASGSALRFAGVRVLPLQPRTVAFETEPDPTTRTGLRSASPGASSRSQGPRPSGPSLGRSRSAPRRGYRTSGRVAIPRHAPFDASAAGRP
jgi:hypothetical protein